MEPKKNENFIFLQRHQNGWYVQYFLDMDRTNVYLSFHINIRWKYHGQVSANLFWKWLRFLPLIEISLSNNIIKNEGKVKGVRS